MMLWRKSNLLAAFLVISTCCAAQQTPTEIKLTIKYNGQIVPDPDHITLNAADHVENVPLKSGKFEVPDQISRAKTWSFAVIRGGYQIQVRNLSHDELAYSNWTLLAADHHYKGDYISEFPKHADIRSSCVLVLESERIDPGLVLSLTHCRSKS